MNLAKPIPRRIVLECISDKFLSVFQWEMDGMNDYVRAAQYSMQAEALIELLEAEDCGSHGGYDKDNPLTKVTNYRLLNRFHTVCKKYGQEAIAREALDCYKEKQ